MAISSKPISMKARWAWFSVVSLVMVGLDQWVKIYAIENWQGLPPRSFFNDVFRIEYAENHGAFLSLFANFPPTARFWILTVFNGVILAGVTGYILFSKKVSWYVFLAFLLVVSGGLGNMIDRVRFGYVVDFFNLGLGDLRTGIFNIADMAITAGFFMMFPLAIWGEEGKKKPDLSPANVDGVTSSAAS